MKGLSEVFALRLARRRRAEFVDEWAIAAKTMSAVARLKKTQGSTRAQRTARNKEIVAMCETTSITKVAKTLGYSRQRIHQIINGDRYYKEVAQRKGK